MLLIVTARLDRPREMFHQLTEEEQARGNAMTDTQSSEKLRLVRQTATYQEAGDEIDVRRVDLEAPWRWLSAGWLDLIAFPHISLIYGAVFAAIAIGMWFTLSSFGWQSMIPVFAGGFMLIGPILGVGLYEASRLRKAGGPVRWSDVLFTGLRSPIQLSLLGLMLFLIFVVWVQIAVLLFMIFMGGSPFLPIDIFIPRLLFTWQGVSLLVVGTVVGAMLAAFVFALSVISAPMLIDRRIGLASAVIASVNATMLNIKPMALWAALIAGFIAVGIATLSFGLIVIFPLIAHATWHACDEIAGGADEG
jgi:uncharacterized membrane protein